MATKSAQLDALFTQAVPLKAFPFTVTQKAMEAANALLGAIIVAASIPLLTAKLDVDTGVTDTNYASGQNPGDISQALAKHNAICTKLDADAGVTDTDYVATCGATAATLYDKYVALLKKLDADAGVNSTNYGATALKTEYTSFLATTIDG